MKPIQIFTAALAFTAPSVLAGVVCEEGDERIVVRRDGKHVLSYQKVVDVPAGVDAKFGRSGFIHPISTPSGRVVTDGYPLPHHSHQHGVYFAWRLATFEGETLNFWEHGAATVRHEKVLEILNEEGSAGFRVELAHVAGARTVLREIWTVVVDGESGAIDFTSEQRCATGSALALERFHYGGMAVRGPRQWFPDAHTSAGKGAVADEFVGACRMLTDEGLTQADGNHSRPKWVCMTGAVDGAAVSITVVPHPGNFRYPQPVRLHPDMPYFCFNPTVDAGFEIEPEMAFVSRFRIVVGDGEVDVGALDAVQRGFALEE